MKHFDPLEIEISALDARLTEFGGDAETRLDLWGLLGRFPKALSTLREHILAGRLQGNIYYIRDRGCFIGILSEATALERAKICCSYAEGPLTPCEKWCLSLRPGQTPANNRKVALTLEMVDLWARAYG